MTTGMLWITPQRGSMLARIHKNRLLPIILSSRATISSVSSSSSSLSFSVVGTRPNSSVTQLAPMARLPSQQGRQVHATSTSYVNHAAPVEANYDTANPPYIRKYLRTYGLTPPRAESYEVQKTRCLAQLALKQTPIDKFLYLSTLRKNNVHLFYRLVTDHLRELTPLIYTPVVGEACQRWSEIYQQPEGMYLSWEDRGNLAAVIANWPQPHVEITCITDGSRILGLGDLGINGMGIPIGKLALYTACAGIRPEATLPLTLDLGTSNKTLREDPLYMGSRRDKITPEEEREFMDELMAALTERWPGIVIQFEDFKNPFPALERYRDIYTCFNDDIQGTGAVILGGVINAVKRSGLPCKDHRAVFFGAGSAGVGVAKQIVAFFMREGMTEDEARSCFYLVDTKGLVTSDRGDKLADHKVYFAREDNGGQQYKTLEEVVDHVKPTILMGLSTIGGVFTPEILRKMADWNTAPIIFPLSNPSSKSECDFETAITHTDGRALFASGSPFQPVSFTNSAGETRTYYPGQGNNMYVFPGIGLGTILSKAVKITDSMIYASGAALSQALTAEEIERGLLYPDLTRIRQVSVVVTRKVMRAAQEDKVDRETALRSMNDDALDAWIKARMYDAHSEVLALEREVGALLHNLNPSSVLNGLSSDENAKL
ncbi:NADP-dependent malic enzyme MaeA [Aspergillus nomiae NRRL 13137]|uniref:Malic enzyme n=1 Tax=Aspergillus nomiae NRRL (strain ATCC 15546 / NRRL 13137 / CBS 260.88 / M93) TaxID=1509407 RepID=A0A0L1J2H6_ASPN3|nr:NADP-dependent malic enzyme MaeA [Aspergillus nomiae NRRL 13137]KNG86006.1 NADP-dependent malic enzyme MaeA [Aspergillus nomiae NRRL 13137]